jgi:hypothetical protein
MTGVGRQLFNIARARKKELDILSLFGYINQMMKTTNNFYARKMVQLSGAIPQPPASKWAQEVLHDDAFAAWMAHVDAGRIGPHLKTSEDAAD